MAPTSVYIIECAGYVKIGVAIDPAKRLKGVNTGSPVPATLYRSREFEASLVAREIESRLHRLFRSRRTNGEWFDMTPQKAWDALRKARPLRLTNPKARNDTVDRWETTGDSERIADLLFQRRDA